MANRSANRSVLDPLLRDSREALVYKLQGLADSLYQAQSPFAHVEDPVPGILSGLTQGRFTASPFTLTDGRNLLGVLEAVAASPTLHPSATLALLAPTCGALVRHSADVATRQRLHEAMGTIADGVLRGLPRGAGVSAATPDCTAPASTGCSYAVRLVRDRPKVLADCHALPQGVGVCLPASLVAGSPSLRAPQLVGLRLCLYGPPPPRTPTAASPRSVPCSASPWRPKARGCFKGRSLPSPQPSPGNFEGPRCCC